MYMLYIPFAYTQAYYIAIVIVIAITTTEYHVQYIYTNVYIQTIYVYILSYHIISIYI